MNISITDIARLSVMIGDNETLIVNAQGRVGKLGLREVSRGLPQGTCVLSQEDFFAALERATSPDFVADLRQNLNRETPFSARTIRTVLARSKVEIETAAHLKHLTDGLKAKADVILGGDPFEGLVQELLGDENVKAVFGDSDFGKIFSAFNAARRAVADAKTALGADHDPVCIAKLAEAEGDLAAAVHAMTGRIRSQVENFSFATSNVLACLDDDATETELNAARIDTLAATLGEL